MANSRSTMHFHGFDLVSIYHDIDKVANVNPHNLNEQNKPDEELEAELPIIDGTSKFRKKHVLIAIAEKDEDFEVISNILKKLENRDNKVNPTNKESKKLINIVRRRRNDYDWGRGRAVPGWSQPELDLLEKTFEKDRIPIHVALTQRNPSWKMMVKY